MNEKQQQLLDEYENQEPYETWSARIHMERDLNEKLATWAGFKKSSNFGRPFWLLPSDDDTQWPWEDFDGEQMQRMPFSFHDRPLPDFTNSLDACFKWLVPKCGHVGISTQGEYFDASVWAKDADSEYDGVMMRESTPALALCKAIEKLIESREER